MFKLSFSMKSFLISFKIDSIPELIPIKISEFKFDNKSLFFWLNIE